MPTYAALLYRLEAEQPEPGSPASQQLYQAWATFNREVGQAGVLTNGIGLQSSTTATSVRVREGKTLITDGPFAETREQLGGILLFECKDLDEAIQWASKVPDAHTGCIELRPVWEG